MDIHAISCECKGCLGKGDAMAGRNEAVMFSEVYAEIKRLEEK